MIIVYRAYKLFLILLKRCIKCITNTYCSFGGKISALSRTVLESLSRYVRETCQVRNTNAVG